MTPSQIDLVQSSFSKVVPIADTAAEIFYNRLFTLDPSIRHMFKSDMKQQGKKLMDSLKMVVGNLRNLDRIVPGVRAMAVRHTDYGVKPYHYALVGEALIDTLATGLGAEFTDDVREAWLAAYTILANTMKAAAEEERAA
jgi:hemoglobin-like flavoprotein